MSLFDQLSGGVSRDISSGAVTGLIQTASQGVLKPLINTISGSVSKTSSVITQSIGGGGIASPFGVTNNSTSWGGLSEFLMARIYPVKLADPTKPDQNYTPDVSEGEILTAVTDVHIEGSFNWHSPFENAGLESKFQSLMALIQSGQISSYANLLQVGLGFFSEGLANDSQNTLNKAATKASEISASLVGKTGITKLNSRQVFAGQPPLKISATLHFRAMLDAQKEVVEPYKLLWKWASPQQLAAEGALPTTFKDVQSGQSLISALFPSSAPLMIGFQYCNDTFLPMVIDGISNELSGPRNSNGDPVYRSVQVSMGSLTAQDRNDINSIFN